MEEITITPESEFQRNDTDFLSAEVDNETVLMHLQDSGYLGLNDVATVIWQLLQEPKSFTAIVDALLQKYEVEVAQCEEEVRAVLGRMVRLNMLRLG